MNECSEDSDTDELPFTCEFEVGVQQGDNEDEWEHYYAHAKSEGEAKRLAREKARGDGMADPTVYMIHGPFEPDDPIRVGKEMISEVFG